MSFIDFDISGLEELQKRLEDLAKGAEELDGEHEVPFGEIFPPSFMKRYTTFESIEKMVEASGYKVENAEDFKAIPETAWDSFVRQRTKFDNWSDMIGKAGEEWTTRQLGIE